MEIYLIISFILIIGLSRRQSTNHQNVNIQQDDDLEYEELKEDNSVKNKQRNTKLASLLSPKEADHK